MSSLMYMVSTRSDQDSNLIPWGAEAGDSLSLSEFMWDTNLRRWKAESLFASTTYSHEVA
jgi:hypothetical protein